MIEIVLIIFFGYMAFRIIMAVRRESEVFREFKQSQSFAWLTLLFPLGPIVYYFAMFRHGGLVVTTLMVACYLPGLIAAKKRIAIFERAGTDRVRNAQNAAFRAFATAIAGLAYTVVVLGLALIGTVKA